MADGLLFRETLAQVISLAEENKQRALKPKVSRQMGLHLDNTLTIQTRRRFVSSMPATIEELRDKYQVMSHMWLLAQMRQPTRPLHADLKESTFSKFLDELLSEKNFLLEREVAGTKKIVSNCGRIAWSTSSSFAKELSDLGEKKGQAIEKALWAAYNNSHHRIEHWLTLLSIANSGGGTTTTKTSSSSSSLNTADQRLQKIERKFAEFERALQRSRSPYTRPKALPAPQGQLALPAPPTPKEQGRKGGKGKNSKDKGNGNKGGPQVQPGAKTFDQIFAQVEINRQSFHSAQQTLVNGTIAVLGVEMSRKNPAIASTTWSQYEQNSFIIILSPYHLRVHRHQSSIPPSIQCL